MENVIRLEQRADRYSEGRQGNQLHGGYGILEEYDVAHYWRNAKVLEIFEGSKDIEKMIIGRKVLGDAKSKPRSTTCEAQELPCALHDTEELDPTSLVGAVGFSFLPASGGFLKACFCSPGGSMTREAAFSCLLLLMSCVLFPSDAFSQAQDCKAAAGQWEFRVFGRDCKGYEEEGKFVMTIDADCSLKIDMLSSIPYAEQYLVTHKSLTVENDRFYATVDFTVDECSAVVLKGQIIDGKRIEGTYRYGDGGSGTFKAVKKKSVRKQRKEDSGTPLFTF